MPEISRRRVCAGLSTALCTMVLPVMAAAQATASFSDVPASHPAFDAVEYLKERGILSGYDDGTFRPAQSVNRAEAVKIIVSSIVKDAPKAPADGSPFSDVAADAWYLPYVEHARRTLKIIDGPPTKTAFQGSNPVKRGEFLKMFLLARDIDAANIFGDLKGALSADVTNASEWYYPYVRYAVASSMISGNDKGLLAPAGNLSRGDIALIVYRLEMFQQERRTQALLGLVDREVARTLELLQNNDSTSALYAANRLVLSARGALLAKPDDFTVKANVKIAESVQLLVRAYQAGEQQKLADVSKIGGDAWHLADKAKGYDPSVIPIANQIQQIAKHMADEARALEKK